MLTSLTGLSKSHQSAILLLLGGLIVRSAIAFFLHPGFDEAYYYLYTLNPSWSYFDHPPLVALSTAFGIQLTGLVNQFTLRIGSLLLYTGSLIFLYRTSLNLFTPQAALNTLALASIIPIFQLGFGVMTLPDSPLIFFWSACLYLSSQEFFTPHYQPTPRLVLIGGLLGLACLGKYHGFVLGCGLLIFCLLSTKHRSALTSPWMGFALLSFLLALSPVLRWNSHHDWISFTYQFSRAVPERHYSLLQTLITILLSIAYLFPSFGFPLWGAIATATHRLITPKPNPDANKHLFLLCISLPLILGFTYIGGYQAILPTWQMPGFWGATPLLGYYSSQWHPRTLKRWLISSTLTIVILIALALGHLSAGIFQTPSNTAWFGGFIPAETDGSTQTIDIQQLRQGLLNPAFSPNLQQTDFIFTNQIFIAGQVAMAIAPLTPQPPITCFSDDLRGFAFWSSPPDWVGKNALYITTAKFANEISHPYSDYFQSLTFLAEIPITRGGQTVETFQIYQATNLLKPYPRPYSQP